MNHPMNSATAVSGLGMTEMGRVYRSATDLETEAVYLAIDDAGIDKSELDGLLINTGITQGLGLHLHVALGLQDLNLLTFMQGYGSSWANDSVCGHGSGERSRDKCRVCFR